MLIQRKKDEQYKINEEILQANRNAMLVIEQRRQKQRDQDDKIATYLKDKAEKEAEILSEQKRIKDEKEK